MDLEKIFHLKENKTDVKTEVIAGITTFMTMAYILAVNPSVLSACGMDSGAVFTATALAALIATLLMAAFSNYPFVLAPGMGLNAYFSYTVVLQMGYSWQTALAAVFIEGIVFILLSLTNVREAIFNAIPMNLKHAVSVGIGLFIAFIGLQNAHIVVDSATLVGVYSFKSSVENGLFNSEGITVVLALVGILVTGILVVKGVKGNILWGILITWGLGILCQLLGIYQVNPEIGMYSLLPDFSNGISVPSLAPTLMQMDFSGILSLDFFVVMFAFLFVDLFDTLGTLIGVASKADMLDKDGSSQGSAAPVIRRHRNLCRRYAWYLHHYHICRECIRRGRGRTYGTYRSCSCNPFWTVPVLVPDFPGHPVLCNGSGSGSSRLSDADLYYKD